MTVFQFAGGLHALANFYEEHPDMPVPYVDIFNTFVDSKDAMAEAARMLGTCDKVVGDDYFELRKQFGRITLAVNISRNQICERVKVSERTVLEEFVPATEAKTIPEHVVDVFEWKCPESILGDTATK